MDKVLDTIHDFVVCGGDRGKCRLRLYRPVPGGLPVVAIATLDWEHPWPSVANEPEEVASGVWRQLVKPVVPVWSVPERDFVWIHHVPKPQGSSLIKEDFARVFLRWEGDAAPAQRPLWSRMPRSEAESLIGQSI